MTWFEENEPEMEVIYAHNFIDFFKFTNPLRRTITFQNVGEVFKTKYITEIDLNIHDVTLNDELIHPLDQQTDSFQYISFESFGTFVQG